MISNNGAAEEATINQLGNQGHEFGIKLSGKTYKILFQNMYSNPIDAVVRELCCNAKDSHFVSGNSEVPFEISIPTAIEHNFVVKDYGTGLSEEDVYKYLGIAGESTKENDNDSIGTFGLGSKSPFAVTDSYIIESRFNGKKMVFLCYLQPSGIPTMTKQIEIDTLEPNGITFSVPVSNYKGYIEAIKNQLILFPVKPIITNMENFEWKPLDVVVGNEFGGFYDTKNTYSNVSRVYVSMGSVLYPFDLHKLENDYIRNRICSNMRYEITILNMKIGEIDIPPSRETISYDDYCLKVLNKKATDFVNLLDKNWIDLVNSVSHVEEFFGEVFPEILAKDHGVLGNPSFTTSPKTLTNFDGQDEWVCDFNKLKTNNGNYRYLFPQEIVTDPAGHNLTKYKFKNRKLSSNINGERIISKAKHGTTSNLDCLMPYYNFNVAGKNYILLIDDKRNVYEKFKHWNKSNLCSLVIELNPTWKEDDQNFNELYEFQKNLSDRFEIMLASKLPAVKRAPNPKKDSLNLRGLFEIVNGFQDVAELKENAILIFTERDRICDTSAAFNSKNDYDWVILKDNLLPKEVVYRVNKSVTKGTLKKLYELGAMNIEDWIKSKIKNDTVSEEFINHTACEKLMNSYHYQYSINKEYDPTGEYKKYINNYLIPKEIKEKWNKPNLLKNHLETLINFYTNYEHYGERFIKFKNLDKFNKEIEMFKTKVESLIASVKTEEKEAICNLLESVRYSQKHIKTIIDVMKGNF